MFVCFFCGKISSGSAVNEDCKVNKTKSYQTWFEPFHKVSPEGKAYGNGRHHFALPSYNSRILDYMKMTDGRGFVVMNDSIDIPIKIHISILF